MAVLAWAAVWIVGFPVHGSDFAVLLALGLFVVGPLVVQRVRRGAQPVSSAGFRSLPRSLRGPSSFLFCLLPLITVGVMAPLCLGYCAEVLHTRALRVCVGVSYGLMLASVGLVNHSADGSTAGALGLWLALVNAVGATVLCFKARQARADSA